MLNKNTQKNIKLTANSNNNNKRHVIVCCSMQSPSLVIPASYKVFLFALSPKDMVEESCAILFFVCRQHLASSTYLKYH